MSFPNAAFYDADRKFKPEAAKRAYFALLSAFSYPVSENLRNNIWVSDFGLGRFVEVGAGGMFWVNDKEGNYNSLEVFLLPNQMIPEHCRGFPVVENGRVLGMVSLTEVKEIPAAEQTHTRVAQVMLPADDSLVVGADTSLAEALVKMSQEGAERLLVMRDRMAGLITKTGLLRFIQIKQVLEG